MGFREPYTSHIREAIRTRYALLPYVYTLFREAATIGTPLMRPLWMEFPHLPHLLDSQRSFMLGPALLVTPVLEEVRGGRWIGGRVKGEGGKGGEGG